MSLKTTRNSGYKSTGEVLKRDYGFDEALNIFSLKWDVFLKKTWVEKIGEMFHLI